MDAIRRLAIGLDFKPLVINCKEVYVYQEEAELDGDEYEYLSLKGSIRVNGNNKVSVADYNEYVANNTLEQYQRGAQEALSLLASYGSQIADRIEVGEKLAQEYGLDWTIETTAGEIDVNMLKHVDWQSSTMACAAYY